MISSAQAAFFVKKRPFSALKCALFNTFLLFFFLCLELPFAYALCNYIILTPLELYPILASLKLFEVRVLIDEIFRTLPVFIILFLKLILNFPVRGTQIYLQSNPSQYSTQNLDIKIASLCHCASVISGRFYLEL